jgi:Zn finger protein HypA/HybF involved in hydrogenase expression
MQNIWCENCDKRWQEDWAKECPDCHEKEIKITMSEEEAKEAGLA